MGLGTLALPRRQQNGDDRRSRLERALLRVHGAMLLSFGFVSVAPLFEADTLPFAQVLPRLVILAAYLVVAVDLQLRGERLVHLAVLAVPLLVVAELQAAPTASDVASGLTVGAIALSAARQLRPAGYVALMVPAGIAHVSVRVLLGGDLTGAVSDVVTGIGLTYAIYAFVEALHHAAERSADADEETTRQRRAAAREDAERRAVAAAGRALHDEVLVALRMVGDASQPLDRTRLVCRQATAAVAEIGALIPSPSSSPELAADRVAVSTVSDLATRVRERSPVQATVSIAEGSGDVVVPGHAFDVVVRAAAECLRNVDRHSGASGAHLDLIAERGELVVSVIDRGVGTPASITPGFGMTRSVIEPVEEIGGSVDLDDTPGGGTTVRLRAPLRSAGQRSPLARAYDLTVRATGTARPIQAITWPVALVWIYIAGRYSFDWPTPWVSLLLAVAYVAATAVVVLRVVRRRPTAVWLTVVALGLLGLNAVSLALAPAGSLLDYRSWTFGFMAAPLVALTMVLPARLAVAVLLPHPVLILLATRLDPSLTDGAVPWGSLNAVLATPIAAIVLGRLLRRIGVRIELEESESARLAAGRASRRSLAAVRTLHLDHTRRRVLPWLTAIADGQVDPRTPSASEKAVLLAAEVRDDLYAPGFLQGDVRQQVTAFRQDGGRLTLRPGFPPGAASPEIHGILGHLLTVLDAQHRVTITPKAEISSGAEQVRVAIIPSAGLALAGPLAGCDIDEDHYRTVVTLPG